MIKIKTSIVSKIVNSKKDLTNDFKRKKEFQAFRVISTVQKENEFITI